MLTHRWVTCPSSISSNLHAESCHLIAFIIIRFLLKQRSRQPNVTIGIRANRRTDFKFDYSHYVLTMIIIAGCCECKDSHRIESLRSYSSQFIESSFSSGCIQSARGSSAHSSGPCLEVHKVVLFFFSIVFARNCRHLPFVAVSMRLLRCIPAVAATNFQLTECAHANARFVRQTLAKPSMVVRSWNHKHTHTNTTLSARRSRQLKTTQTNATAAGAGAQQTVYSAKIFSFRFSWLAQLLKSGRIFSLLGPKANSRKEEAKKPAEPFNSWKAIYLYTDY